MIDSHCHIDFSQFDSDRDAVLKRCKLNGITSIIIPGVSELQWHKAQNLCAAYGSCFYSVGLHPWYIDTACENKALEVKDWVGEADRLCTGLMAAAQSYFLDPKCLAVGECGLDALINTPLDVQKTFFKAHIELANTHNKPLIIHSRKTHAEVLAMLKKKPIACGGVVHGFSGSYEQAHAFIRLGLLIGVGGTITYERAKKTRNAIKRLPKDAIVLETDAPDMPLRGKQGQRNSPEYLAEIVQYLALLRMESVDEVGHYTSSNSEKLFGLPKSRA